jgi:hypothetical protein
MRATAHRRQQLSSPGRSNYAPHGVEITGPLIAPEADQPFTLSATGFGSGPKTWQWEEAPDDEGAPGVWAEIEGANDPELTTELAVEDDGTWFRAKLTNEQGSDTSDPLQINLAG